MAQYAVIDLGSNSVRLVVFNVANPRKKSFAKKDFSTLLNVKDMAGLAAYIDEGVFTPAGVKKAVRVLKNQLRTVSYFKCKRVDIFATAVLRNAVNGAESARAIESAIGHSICLLSGPEEAHLGYVGARLERSIDRGTLIDIGGGSTELSRVVGGGDVENVSVPAGSLSSFTTHVAHILPTADEVHRIAEAASAELARIEDLPAYRTDVIYGIGGSVRAVPKTLDQLHPEGWSGAVTLERLNEVIDACTHDPSAFAHVALKAAAERVHTIVPGCVILREVFSELGATRLEICKCGIREGYLAHRMLA